MAPYHMYKIVVGGVNGQDPTLVRDRLHRDHILRVEFRDLELKTTPSGEPEGVLCRFLVPHVPISYPNTTNQKIPLVYPLSMLVKGLDGKFDFSVGGVRVSPKRRTGASESHQNLDGAIPYV